uniref:Kin17_mid domain-containing protein n=1 Tax=Caenorhabditis tropicalis TaxID=1561998 RepID=A0A1I7UZS8_9PELO
MLSRVSRKRELQSDPQGSSQPPLKKGKPQDRRFKKRKLQEVLDELCVRVQSNDRQLTNNLIRELDTEHVRVVSDEEFEKTCTQILKACLTAKIDSVSSKVFQCLMSMFARGSFENRRDFMNSLQNHCDGLAAAAREAEKVLTIAEEDSDSDASFSGSSVPETSTKPSKKTSIPSSLSSVNSDDAGSEAESSDSEVGYDTRHRKKRKVKKLVREEEQQRKIVEKEGGKEEDEEITIIDAFFLKPNLDCGILGVYKTALEEKLIEAEEVPEKIVLCARRSLAQTSLSSTPNRIAALEFHVALSVAKGNDATDCENLLLCLSTDRDFRVRKAVAEGLLALSAVHQLAKSTYSIVKTFMGDSDPDIRIAAIRLLIFYANSIGEETLEDKEDGKLISNDAFSSICDAVNDIDIAVRVEAAKKLGDFLTVSEDLIYQTLDKKMMRSDKNKQVVKVEQSLFALSKKAASAQKDRRWKFAKNAPKAEQPTRGGWSRGKELNAVVVVEDKKGEEEEEGESIIPHGACGAFVSALEDEFMDVRKAAVYSLGRLACSRPAFAVSALEYLADMFNDEIADVRLDAINALTPLVSHGQLNAEQLNVISKCLDDAMPESRQAMRELLKRAQFTDVACVEMCVKALLACLQRFPKDKEQVYSCMAVIGRNHAVQVQAIMRSLLGINLIFHTRETSIEDQEYVGRLVMVLNAASIQPSLVFFMPEFVHRHYRLLRNSYPDIVREIRVLDEEKEIGKTAKDEYSMEKAEEVVMSTYRRLCNVPATALHSDRNIKRDDIFRDTSAISLYNSTVSGAARLIFCLGEVSSTVDSVSETVLRGGEIINMKQLIAQSIDDMKSVEHQFSGISLEIHAYLVYCRVYLALLDMLVWMLQVISPQKEVLEAGQMIVQEAREAISDSESIPEPLLSFISSLESLFESVPATSVNSATFIDEKRKIITPNTLAEILEKSPPKLPPKFPPIASIHLKYARITSPDKDIAVEECLKFYAHLPHGMPLEFDLFNMTEEELDTVRIKTIHPDSRDDVMRPRPEDFRRQDDHFSVTTLVKITSASPWSEPAEIDVVIGILSNEKFVPLFASPSCFTPAHIRAVYVRDSKTDRIRHFERLRNNPISGDIRQVTSYISIMVSALPHSTVHSAIFSRRHNSIICAGPYEVLPLEACLEPLPSTSSLCEGAIECLQLSTDERHIAVANNAILKIADIKTGHEVRILTGHTQPITSLAASKFNPYCWYTGSSDCTWTQWDHRMHPSKVFGSHAAGVIRSLALSPGDHYLAVGTDETIQIFDARQRSYITQFNCSGHSLELHPSDVLLSAVGHDRIVRFFCLETFGLISQSDPFLDDIQASAFDTHVMIAATNDSINLLTWEPCCDVLTTVPLKNVEKVVSVHANGLDLDFICIGENTERLEMRTYAIEELLSYSPSHELCGSIYEEDEDIDASDLSPIEEGNVLLELVDLTPGSPVLSSEEAETSTSPVNSSSSHSSPASPAKPAQVKQRSQKLPKTSASTSSKSTTSSSSKTLNLNNSKTSSRSVTPISTKPPTRPVGTAKSVIVSNRPSLSGYNRGQGATNPSPSMLDLRTTRSVTGSTQSLLSERGQKKRSISSRRNQESITITYLGRPRTPSEGDLVGSVTSSTSRNRRSSPSVSKKTSPPSMYAITSSPVKKPNAPVKKQNSISSMTSTSSKGGGIWGVCIDTVHDIGVAAKKENRNIRRLKMLTARRQSCSDVPPEVCADEQLVLIATKILSRRNDWSLNTCFAYLPVVIENLASVDLTNRTIALEGLIAITETLGERLVKFSSINSHKIGVDVVAEERAEKAKTCIQHLREVVKKRDWLYKQLDEDTIFKEGHTNNNKTIPPLGRQKSPGQNHSVIRQRQHSPAGSKNKTIPTALSLPTIDKKKGLPKKYLPRTSSRWSVCITVVNEIGTVANKNIKNIRHLKLAVSRGMETYDEEVVLTATRLLSRCNENITSIDRRNRFIALEGLGAISSGMVDKLEKFSTEFAHRTEGNSLAGEKAEKAKICIQIIKMGKHEKGSSKELANRTKSKGLQKLKWFCQMCQKQCRDANGFKCHLTSEAHQRQLLLFAENSNSYLRQFSNDFEKNFMQLLRTSYGTKRVRANEVYNVYIKDKGHVHMNSTVWHSLTGFVQYLGSSGKCKIDEGDKGWYIAYIDQEAVIKKEEEQRKQQQEKDDEDRHLQIVEEMVQRGRELEGDDAEKYEATELIREAPDQKIQLFGGKSLGKLTETAKVPLMSVFDLKPVKKEDPDRPGPSGYSDTSRESRKRSRSRSPSKKISKKSTLDEIKEMEERKKEKKNRKDYWMREGIVVKVVTKSLGSDYYRAKGVVRRMVDDYKAEVKLDDGMVVKLDQEHVETVIPSIGRQMMVVNGAYRGSEATLESIDEKSFSLRLKLSAGPARGRRIEVPKMYLTGLILCLFHISLAFRDSPDASRYLKNLLGHDIHMINTTQDAVLELSNHWIDQAMSALIATVANEKISTISHLESRFHEKCVKEVQSIDQHAECVSDLLHVAHTQQSRQHGAKILIKTFSEKAPASGWIGAFRIRKRRQTQVVSQSSYILKSEKDDASPFTLIAKQITKSIRTLKNKKEDRGWQQIMVDVKKTGELIENRKKIKEMIGASARSRSPKPRKMFLSARKPLANDDYDTLDDPMQMTKRVISKKYSKENIDLLFKRFQDHPEEILKNDARSLLNMTDQETEAVLRIRFRSEKFEICVSQVFRNISRRAKKENDTISILSPSLFSLHDKGTPEEQKTSLVKLLGNNQGIDKNSFIDMITEITGVADTVDDAAQKIARDSEGTLMNVKGVEVNVSRQNLTKIYGEENYRKMKVLEKLHGMYTEEQVIKEIGKGNIKIGKYEKRMRDIIGSPILFSSIIASPATASQALIASPVLFTPLVLSPAIYGSVILSPWVFVPVILGPRVLSPIIVSPAIFSPIVLSPLALDPLILVPGVANPVVLSPFVLCPFVLSPQVMTPIILSPFALSPFILTPTALSPLILSPFVLSPTVLSPSFVTAVIMSPYALSPSPKNGVQHFILKEIDNNALKQRGEGGGRKN